MKDRVENLAEFLYRRARGLDLDAPLPEKDDFIWKAFRRQAKDLILFGDANRRAEVTESAKDRIERGIEELSGKIHWCWDDIERNRLRGKIDGLKLALSYIEEEERMAESE